MISHVGIQIQEDDLNAFYISVLGGQLDHSFQLNADTSEQFFNIPSRTNVHLLKLQDFELELFVHTCAHPNDYNHVCIVSDRAEEVFKRAIEAGYKVNSRTSQGHETYFIYDRNQNVFELKLNERITQN